MVPNYQQVLKICKKKYLFHLSEKTRAHEVNQQTRCYEVQVCATSVKLLKLLLQETNKPSFSEILREETTILLHFCSSDTCVAVSLCLSASLHEVKKDPVSSQKQRRLSL